MNDTVKARIKVAQGRIQGVYSQISTIDKKMFTKEEFGFLNNTLVLLTMADTAIGLLMSVENNTANHEWEIE